jgi:hypothetical protein
MMDIEKSISYFIALPVQWLGEVHLAWFSMFYDTIYHTSHSLYDSHGAGGRPDHLPFVQRCGGESGVHGVG